MIHLLEASKAYADRNRKLTVVFRPTTMSIPTDRRVGILGDRGTGKTTLLKLLTGQEAPSEGEVLTNARLSPLVGMPRLVSLRLTGLENATYFARLYGLPVEAVLEYVAVVSGLGDDLVKPLKDIRPAVRAWLLFCIVGALQVDCLVADGAPAGQHPVYAPRARQMILDGLVAPGLIFASGVPNAVRNMCEHVIVIRDGILWPFDDVEEGIRFYKDGCEQ